MTLGIPAQDGSSRPSELRIGRGMYDEIVAHLRNALPNEGCGLIAGRTDANGWFTAARFYPGENTDRSPTRFTMDGAQVVAAFRDMRNSGLELGAIVHSHPTSLAVPSPTDAREAFYPDALTVIVSFRSAVAEIRVWQWLPDEPDKRFQEGSFVLVDEGDSGSQES